MSEVAQQWDIAETARIVEANIETTARGEISKALDAERAMHNRNADARKRAKSASDSTTQLLGEVRPDAALPVFLEKTCLVWRQEERMLEVVIDDARSRLAQADMICVKTTTTIRFASMRLQLQESKLNDQIRITAESEETINRQFTDCGDLLNQMRTSQNALEGILREVTR